MPLRPQKPCSAPACGVLVRGARYCDKHAHLTRQAAQQHEERRESSAKRGYSYKWQQARKGFLSKHPLCVQCELVGVVTASTDVDHIVPHRGDKELFWTRSNWQALCHSCHSRKTATEDGGWGNARPG
jgi:5-methylcytosine-specific restriction protein A